MTMYMAAMYHMYINGQHRGTTDHSRLLLQTAHTSVDAAASMTMAELRGRPEAVVRTANVTAA